MTYLTEVDQVASGYIYSDRFEKIYYPVHHQFICLLT